MGSPATPSVTDFRRLLDGLMAEHAGQHVVVLALDGVTFDVARACWPSGDLRLMRAVTPTTSSACWLSALTGRTVADHAVPGVVFTAPSGGPRLINVLDYHGDDLTAAAGTVFSDAARHGRVPLAVLGDMEHYGSAWRDALLTDALRVPGHSFYTEHGTYHPRPSGDVGARVRTAIEETLARHGTRGPCLLWCYVEVDQHVHRHGYDTHTTEVLTALGEFADTLTRRGVVVVAHADHGLVPTVHDPALAGLLDGMGQSHGFTMGGAGRMRWLYPDHPAQRAELSASLRAALPDDIRVLPADQVFAAGSAARSRVGDVLLVAEGERFLTESDYRFDHGSFAAEETDTPFAVWR
ncbi:alkaline phosphatase family protein [Streptomyces sp. CRN 30]|uniref:alkaline phosphatase family protein n=1 Tax=Streptomyces sp. CRN 30 TaxID=3075613 RepID=UPI002A80886F|nr:alkaline phosphatase family protein [Streptomyces sp. CRN 30]